MPRLVRGRYHSALAVASTVKEKALKEESCFDIVRPWKKVKWNHFLGLVVVKKKGRRGLSFLWWPSSGKQQRRFSAM